MQIHTVHCRPWSLIHSVLRREPGGSGFLMTQHTHTDIPTGSESHRPGLTSSIELLLLYTQDWDRDPVCPPTTPSLFPLHWRTLTHTERIKYQHCIHFTRTGSIHTTTAMSHYRRGPIIAIIYSQYWFSLWLWLSVLDRDTHTHKHTNIKRHLIT